MPRKSDWNLGKGAWTLLDLFVASCSAALVPLFWTPLSETLRKVALEEGMERLIAYAIFYGFAFVVAGVMLGLHESRTHRSLRFRTAIGFIAASGACLALLLLVYFIEYRFIGRFALLKIGGCSLMGVMILRGCIGRMASRSKPRVLALVPDALAETLNERATVSQIPVRLLGPDEWQAGDKKDFVKKCRDLEIDEIVTVADFSEKQVSASETLELLSSGTRVSDLVDFWERNFANIPPDHVDEVWFTRLDLHLRHPLFHRAKRCLDVLVALLGLVLSIPILALASLLTFLDAGLPIFFFQRRTGFLGGEFTLIKLRTMKVDAEKDGAKWAQEKDSRVTALGRWFRKLRIDELPQFINVLKGEMSIVGPRPERPELEETLTEEIPLWSSRHLVKPGLTGWAQIRFRYAADANASKEKLAYDLYYIKNASLLLDLQIILSTVRSLAQGSR